jgi:geranylgeranyl diphosphate synthase type II
VSEYPDDLREQVDDYLAGLTFGTSGAVDGLSEAMRYSLMAPGKRIRPVLALATGRSAGLEPTELMPTAAALELIHTYSLIHDDLPAMDDDELRRGRPTSHVVYGENVAILAGDGLFAEAIHLIAAEQAGGRAAVLEAIAEITAATAVEGMVGGQYIDVTADPAAVDADALRRLHSLKTGRLISASVTAPLALAELPEAERDPYRRFAAELGVLFQIVDDILDVTSTSDELGKPQGSDERHGKATYVSLFGLKKARELAASSRQAAQAALAEVSRPTGELAEIADYIHTRQT